MAGVLAGEQRQLLLLVLLAWLVVWEGLDGVVRLSHRLS